jgi:Domain of unknown function (DUF1816)
MQTLTRGSKRLVLNLPRLFSGDWWVEITTSDPGCIYYFGPFLSFQEASDNAPGYIQDLSEEGAQNIRPVIKRCEPAELTKCEDDEAIYSGVKMLESRF